MVCPLCQEVLGIWQITEVLLAKVQQTFLLLLCVPLFQQHHSFQIDGVWKHDDSWISLHWLCQFLKNCQCERLSTFPTAHEVFLNSIPSPGKFWFCIEKIESIEWQDFAPRPRVGDCFVVHLPL